MTQQIQKPEVLSPVGYWPQLEAAIEAGADAVYFGLKHFTARAKVGFTLTELPELMHSLHRRGVKGYVTFNTLVFDHELREAARTLAAIAEAGADAIIVQDVAVVQLARRIAPELAVHGSTQMSITSAEGVRLAQRLGASRVVLARELSLDDVREIRAHTDCELEIFVHGALCVSYSGQCFSSEAWGGRSANRGQCAQACRLPYEMIVDERVKPLADARYLLSPGDLYTVQQIPEIVRIGISTLKIEGRYKDAKYVALTTQAYRKAVDEAWAGLPLSITRGEELQLAQVYSRGLGPYFVGGTNHQAVVGGRSPRHRGVLMGRVARVLPERVIVRPEPANEIAPLKAGDGVVFDAADWRSPELEEEGGRIYQVAIGSDGLIELRFGHGAIDPSRIRAGDLVWRTHDPELDKVTRPLTQASKPVHKQPLRAVVTAHEGQPLSITWSLVEQPAISTIVRSDEPLAVAQNQAISADYLREQLGRLGNTAYELADLQLDLRGRPFAPSSLLNHLRRAAVDQLVALQSQPPARTVNDPIATLEAALSGIEPVVAAASAPQLHLLVRTPAQLAAALELNPASITLDYLELYGLRPAVEQVQSRGIVARVASPRVLKPSEQRIVRFLQKLDCEILVRSTGLLEALQALDHRPLIGDFSLNAANVLSADSLLRLGLARFTPTHDLNAEQIAGLARQIGPERVETVAYQHLPVFHTEHCVFCRFLSNGTSFKDCGHPCEKHRVALRDVNGRAHPVMADVGCRNTVFGAEAQEASRFLDQWRAAGIRHFRLEFVHETAEQVTQIVRAFAETLSGAGATHELSQQLQRIAPQGTTQGSLFVPDTYLMLPVLQ
jgi:U32 family peptidase